LGPALNRPRPGQWTRGVLPQALLAYLAAGIGFCFMTQLGRYAHIVKQRVSGVRLSQRNSFEPGDEGRWRAGPVQTDVFVDTDESDEATARLVAMGAQTCFLHAAMRDRYPTTLSVTLNGRPLTIQGAGITGANGAASRTTA
jgi:hypothetical protein